MTHPPSWQMALVAAVVLWALLLIVSGLALITVGIVLALITAFEEIT